jgi:cytochrome c biogenesis protein CcdA
VRKKVKKIKWDLGGSKSVLAGFILFIVNLPLSVAYFGLLLLIVKEKAPFSEGVIVMLVFTFFFTAPYVLTAVFYQKYEKKVRRFLDKVFKFLGSRYVFGTILLAIGLYLIFG